MPGKIENSFYRIYLRGSSPQSPRGLSVVWCGVAILGGGDYKLLHPSPTPGLESTRGFPSSSTQFLEIGPSPTLSATHRSPGVSLAGSSTAFSLLGHGPLSQTT